MTITEVKDNISQFVTNTADIQDKFKEVDWRAHAITFFSFGKEKAIDAYQTAKNDSLWVGFKKAYRLAEYVPYLNWYTGMGRLGWAAAYGVKVSMASWTTRPFKYGIVGTFKKFWMEEVPYILKQIIRGGFTVYLTSRFDESTMSSAKSTTAGALAKIKDKIKDGFELLKTKKPTELLSEVLQANLTELSVESFKQSAAVMDKWVEAIYTEYSGIVLNLTAAAFNYTYDVVTTNVESLKKNRFIPNYWA